MNIRQIPVSMDVFAALWTKRQAGEDSENAILERLLGLPKGPPLPSTLALSPVRAAPTGGIYNNMFDVHFREGFEIFRVYKGRNYSAIVQGGRWVMSGQAFPSLFALSMAIIDSRENPWMHWKFRNAEGQVNFISILRKIPPGIDETASGHEGEPIAPRKKKSSRARRNTRR